MGSKIFFKTFHAVFLPELSDFRIVAYYKSFPVQLYDSAIGPTVGIAATFCGNSIGFCTNEIWDGLFCFVSLFNEFPFSDRFFEKVG